MCLAVPMKIVTITEPNQAVADLAGVQYQVDLSLLSDPKVGDYVIVHAGFAIELLDEEEALARIELFRAIGQESES